MEDCEFRQIWYREHAEIEDLDELPFVSSASQTDAPEKVARQMQETLNFPVENRQAYKNWGESYRKLIDAADTAGILVMVSGVVGSNTHRKLNPEEFRGFAISDSLAPLVFVNGADTKAIQLFTLAHELAHIWLGSSALSNCSLNPQSGLCDEEIWCDAVASEFLVPEESLNRELREDENLTDSLRRLAGVFKVSRLVILRRLLDSGRIDGERFTRAWRDEIVQPQNRSARVAGGDFYETTLSRVNRRFAEALLVSTLEGHTLYRDAFRMLSIKRSRSFDELARRMGKIQ